MGDRSRNLCDATYRRRIATIAFFAIVLGVFARLDSLDRKVLWRDESFSLLRIAGHSENELYALFDGRIHSSDQMLALQHVTPELGLAATISSLHEEPQRGPLYYLLARLWIGLSGNATAAVRGISVLLGFVGIGIAFLLGRRLAGVEGGFIFAALIALSPIEIRFSQQVREYILVADLTLLSALLFLRALDRPGASRWFCYGICLLAGLYTNVTFACVIFAHGLVALIAARSSGEKRVLATGFLAATAGAASLYAPWFYAASKAAARHSSDLAWAAGSYSLRSIATKWAFNAGAVFFDSEYAHLRWGIVLLPILSICAAAVARAFLRGDPTSRALALAVTFSTLVPLVGLDSVHGSHFALVARYEIATWVGLSMLVTSFIGGLAAGSTRSRSLAVGMFGALIVVGGISVFADRPFSEWWDNNDHLSESAVAEVVRTGPQPALVVASVADNDAYDTFVLSRYLEPGTRLLLTGDRPATIPTGYAATYFFTPSRSQLARATTSRHTALRNVSPQPEFPVPELNAGNRATVDTVAYGNALWRLSNYDRLSERK